MNARHLQHTYPTNDVCSAQTMFAVRWSSHTRGPRRARWLLALTAALEVGLRLATELAVRSMEGSFLQCSICSTGRRALLSLYVQRTQAVTYCRCCIHQQTRFCRIQEEGSKRRTERLGATRAGPDRKHRRFEVPMGALSPPGNPWGSSE